MEVRGKDLGCLWTLFGHRDLAQGSSSLTVAQHKSVNMNEKDAVGLQHALVLLSPNKKQILKMRVDTDVEGWARCNSACGKEIEEMGNGSVFQKHTVLNETGKH